MDKTQKVMVKAVQKAVKEAKPQTPPPPKFSGVGTRARLNTAAEKHFFKSQLSK